MPLGAVKVLSELLVASAVGAVVLRHLRHGVAALAVQGLCLGALAALASHSALGIVSALLAVGAKAVLVPWLLHRTALRTVAFERLESVSSWAYAGIVGVLVSVRLIAPGLGSAVAGPALVALMPAALAATLLGLLVVASRQLLTGQILGLALTENGLYAAGIALTHGLPAVLDLAILLDLFLALLVLLWLTGHVQATWGHIDVDRLDQLRG